MSQGLTTLWRPSNTEKILLCKRDQQVLLESLNTTQPGSLMTDAQVEAEPADGNQYMFAARMVGDLDTWVTVDGTPRTRGDNLAGYANYVHGGAANEAPSEFR